MIEIASSLFQSSKGQKASYCLSESRGKFVGIATLKKLKSNPFAEE